MSGLIINDLGTIRLYYRKLYPWVPVEPWEPGNLGVPVCDGPNGSRISLIICHDGMFPEMAGEAACKGAEVILRTAGHTAPIRHAWKITNQANAFCNLAVTASVRMCGSDGSFDSMDEGMFCNFDGTLIAEGGGRLDEIVTAEVRPDLVREAAGASKTICTSYTTAATWRLGAGRRIAPTPICMTWRRVLTGCPGSCRSRTAHPADSKRRCAATKGRRCMR